MLTPELLQILHQNTMKPRAQAFTAMSALHHRALLLSWLDCLYLKPGPPNLIAKQIKDFFQRILPPYVIAALKHCAAVTPEKMASPLDFNPDLPHYWSFHPHDTISGAFIDCSSSSFSGFSICHPI